MQSPLKKSFAAEQLRLRQKKRPAIIISVVAVIVAVIAVGYALYTRYVALPGKAEITSIAVLPLANLSGDPEQKYFSDGMHDALISNLSKIKALRVISRTSVMGYRDTEKKVPEIARELGVDALLEGSVYCADNQVRITVQLIAAEPEQHLWSNEYERELREVMSLQGEIARSIADEIEITVTPEEKERLASTHPVNTEAYDLYLQAIDFESSLSSENRIELLHQAIDKDPDFALAYAVIASIYNLSGYTGNIKADEGYMKARDYARRALEIDDTLPEAYNELAFTAINYDWDWDEAHRSILHAISIYPGNADIHHTYFVYLKYMGRYDEALAEIMTACTLDPLGPVHAVEAMEINRIMGRYDEALAIYDRWIAEGKKTIWFMNWIRDRIYYTVGEYEKALESEDNYKKNRVWSFLGYVYGLMGDSVKAQQMLQNLIQSRQDDPENYISPVWDAFIHLGLGDYEKVYECLYEALENHDSLLLFVRPWPEFDPIKNDPRFNEIMKKTGQPEWKG